MTEACRLPTIDTITDGSPNSNAVGRRTQSCAECRRRRIRCDGHYTPCRQCIYYQVPHLCHYPTRKVRSAPSTKAYAELSAAYEASRNVLRTLFPLLSISELSSLPREQLVGLLHNETTAHSPKDTETSDNVEDDIQVLEQSPARGFEWDEPTGSRFLSPRIEDDVNGLSMAFDTSNRSYLGITSIPAILRVIIESSAQVRQAICRQGPRIDGLAAQADASVQRIKAPEVDEGALIDAYFDFVHINAPMIDEVDFRQCRAKGGPLGENRGPLNMVLVMGYIASNGADQTGHSFFYERASQHLNLSCFGSGHLYTIQALALFGGQYLHYVNRPNMASAIMGATLRMAVAVGLHRVTDDTRGSTQDPPTKRSTSETRIRTWWSLFCLDTWAGITLGRPSLRCWDPSSVTTPPPPLRDALDFENISLRVSREFCKIATRIEDRLAKQPPLTPTDVIQYDEELLAWRAALHPVLQDGNYGPRGILVIRGQMQCRLMTLRLTLHRPCLLITTRKRMVNASISNEELEIGRRCCTIALETIDQITRDWLPNQISAWSNVWHLFQAAVVVLLFVLSDPEHPEKSVWEASICKTLEVLNSMRRWSSHAARSHDVIQLIFEARMVSHCDENIGISDAGILDLLDMDMFDDGTNWDDLFDFSTAVRSETPYYR